MSAPTLLSIIAGIDTRLATISGLRHDPFVADTVNPPHAVVAVPDIPEYRATFIRGQVDLEIDVYLFVGEQMDRASQASLAGFVDYSGSSSIPLAIEADRTLGGTVQDCVVKSYRNLTPEQVAGTGFIGGVFTVVVIATGA